MASGALFGFRQTSRRRLHRLHDFRLPSTDVVDPTAVGGYGPAPSAIFNFISITITIHFISFASFHFRVCTCRGWSGRCMIISCTDHQIANASRTHLVLCHTSSPLPSGATAGVCKNSRGRCCVEASHPEDSYGATTRSSDQGKSSAARPAGGDPEVCIVAVA